MEVEQEDHVAHGLAHVSVDRVPDIPFEDAVAARSASRVSRWSGQADLGLSLMLAT